MSYIVSPDKPKDCIFCTMPAEDRDRENAIVHRGRECFVILNAYPYNPGHLMIVPYRHAGSLLDLTDTAVEEIMELTRRSLGILNRAMSPEGMNIGINQGPAAGAGIAEHVHQHVVPRWVGDTNFMTSLGHTKVLPELVTETYDKLAPLFSSDE